MSDVGTEDRDLRGDSGKVREHIEAAIAHHRPHPDQDFVERTIVERDGQVRRAKQDGAQQVREIKDLRPEDRLRATIRNSIGQEKLRAANEPAKDQVVSDGQQFLHNKPPDTWSTEAKAAFNALPEPVRLAVLREQNYNLNTFGPLAAKHAELEEAIKPHRHLVPQGMKEADVVSNMFKWYEQLRGPNSGQAFVQLMNQSGLTIQDLVNAAQGQAYQQQPHYPQPYQQQSEIDAGIRQQLSTFAESHPQFEQVRVAMGQLAQTYPQAFTGADGQPDLEGLYNVALQYSTGGVTEAGIQQQLTSFAQNHPRFQELRRTMGELLAAAGTGGKYGPTGSENLEKLYNDAIRRHDEKTKANVSPSSRSPSGVPMKSEKGKGIRAAIQNAIAENRERRL